MPASAAGESGTTAFRPVTPCRLIDTREDGSTVLADGVTFDLEVRGRCDIASDATAVAVTITVTDPQGPGFVTAWPSGGPMPLASISNFAAGETRANGALLSLGTDGALSLFVSRGAHVVVDATGEFAPSTTASAGRYTPVPPIRALDTRDGAGALAPNSTVTVQLPAVVPTDATALAVMLTLTDAPSPGFVTAFPSGTTRPMASSLNTDAAHQTRTATQVVPVSPAGLSAFVSSGGHLVVDVVGYFTGASADRSANGLFVPSTPARVLDTRSGSQIFPHGAVLAAVSGVTGAGVAAIAANITVTDTGPAGYVTAFAARTLQPETPAVTYDARFATAANLGLVAVSAAGIAVASTSGTQAVVDVTGWFTGSPADMTTGVPGNAGPSWVQPDGPTGCLQYVTTPSADGVFTIQPGSMQTVAHIFAAGPKGPIVVVGDSLTAGSANQTARALRERGWGPICVDGTISRTVEFGSVSVPDGLDAVMRIKASDAIWTDPAITWVVALGTNDVGFSNGNRARSDRFVADMLAAIGPNPVSWMNVHTSRVAWQGAEGSFNESIAALSTTVIDWYGAAVGMPWMAGDHVHLNPTGYQARADILAAGVPPN